MPEASRRTFLAAAGAGAALASTAGLAASAEAAPSDHPSDSTHDSPGAADATPLVAFLRGSTAGELTLLSGEQERVVHDPELVRRLRRASGR
jgi:hypothetical protein